MLTNFESVKKYERSRIILVLIALKMIMYSIRKTDAKLYTNNISERNFETNSFESEIDSFYKNKRIATILMTINTHLWQI